MGEGKTRRRTYATYLKGRDFRKGGSQQEKGILLTRFKDPSNKIRKGIEGSRKQKKGKTSQRGKRKRNGKID